MTKAPSISASREMRKSCRQSGKKGSSRPEMPTGALAYTREPSDSSPPARPCSSTSMEAHAALICTGGDAAGAGADDASPTPAAP